MNDKENALIKLEKYEPLPRRLFLGDLVKFAKLLALGSITLPSGLLLTSGCGNLSSKSVPGKDDAYISVQINGADGVDQDGNPLIRANSRDLLEFVATVRGLSSAVGFFLSTNWGVFQGGTIGPDGFTYYEADEDGKARAVFVAGASAGRAELRVKSKQKTASKLITFDFASLTIFPSSIVFSAASVGTPITVVARGGKGPIEWSTSNPRAVNVSPSGAEAARLTVGDWEALLATGTIGVTLYAFDSEGQTATAIITAGTSSCTTGVIDINPASVAGIDIPAGGVSVSVTLDDFDRGNATSVSVTITGPGTNTTLALSQWLTQGIFQGLYTVASGAASGTYTFSVPEETDATCKPGITVGTFSVT